MKYWLAFCLALTSAPLAAQSDFKMLIEMTDRGASTYYVDVGISGVGMEQFLVDTGSSYTTINERTLTDLVASEQAEYIKDLEGVLADGSKQVVPLYNIKSLTVGGTCRLNDVRAAVFPGDTRNILGLSALRNASPFEFSVDPPTLKLSNCFPGTIHPETDGSVAAGSR